MSRPAPQVLPGGSLFENDDVSLLNRDVGRVTRITKQSTDAFEHLGVGTRQPSILDRVLNAQFQLRNRERLVERDQRAAIGERHQRHTRSLFQRARGIDHDDGPPPECGKFGGRMRPFREFRLRQAYHGATQIGIDPRQGLDHFLWERQGDRARGSRKFSRPSALRRDRASDGIHKWCIGAGERITY